MGADWFLYLLKYTPYRFCVRVKDNTKIGAGQSAQPAKVMFAHLQVGHTQVLQNKCVIWEHSLYMRATRLEDRS